MYLYNIHSNNRSDLHIGNGLNIVNNKRTSTVRAVTSRKVKEKRLTQANLKYLEALGLKLKKNQNE